jgi:hypothetical protein
VKCTSAEEFRLALRQVVRESAEAVFRVQRGDKVVEVKAKLGE